MQYYVKMSLRFYQNFTISYSNPVKTENVQEFKFERL